MILRALSEVLDKPIAFDSFADVRARLAQVAPHLSRHDTRESIFYMDPFIHNTDVARGPFAPFFNNFFFTNAISRSSRIMAKCAATLKNSTNSYLAAPSQAPAASKVASANKPALAQSL